MEVNLKIIKKSLIVRFDGELDHHTAADIRTRIDQAYTEKMLKNIVLDLNNLQFMDSSGIGLIMGRYKLVSQNGGKIFLVHVSPRVLKILKMSGILKIVQLADSVEEALENI